MPTVRKITPDEAAKWEDEPIPTPADPRGMTRMNYPQHGSVGWMARVYTPKRTYARYFADEAHGGAAAALHLAEDWREQMRSTVEVHPRIDHTGTVRVVRVDQPRSKLIGWYIYVWPKGQGRIRRYFSDTAYGGTDQARQTGEEWARGKIREAELAQK